MECVNLKMCQFENLKMECGWVISGLISNVTMEQINNKQ